MGACEEWGSSGFWARPQFPININDLDKEIKCLPSKYANDTKLPYPIKSTEGYLRVQHDLNFLVKL